MIARFQFVDFNGFESAPSLHVDTAAVGSAIQATMVSLSGGISELLKVTQVLPGAGISGLPTSYQSVADVAQFIFANSVTGSRAVLQLPCPLDLVFQADTETIDPGTVGILTAAVLAGGMTPAGDFIDTFLGGFRRRLLKRGYNG